MKASTRFEITLEETNRNFSYDLNRKNVKQFGKLCDSKNICINGMPEKGDIHGLTWDERTILEIITIDNGKCLVANVNGLQWVTSMDRIQFCTKEGLKLKTS